MCQLLDQHLESAQNTIFICIYNINFIYHGGHVFLVFDNLSLWTGTSHFGKLRTEIGLGPRLQTLACQLAFHLVKMLDETWKWKMSRVRVPSNRKVCLLEKGHPWMNHSYRFEVFHHSFGICLENILRLSLPSNKTILFSREIALYELKNVRKGYPYSLIFS